MPPLVIATLLLFLSGPVLAEPSLLECAKKFVPAPGGYDFVGDDEYETGPMEDLKIGQIHYTRLQIFDESDPRENNRLYRWANRLHVTTKEDIVSSQVLVTSGQDYDPRLIEETSRLLRRRKYLYDADVRPVKVCDDTIDLEVITRDIWSFTPELSFKRSGGENTSRVSIRETNLLGSGQELSLISKNDIDRDTTQFAYKNNNLGQSRVAGRAVYTDNDDGSEGLVFVHLPFYSLDSRQSWGIRLNRFERKDRQFSHGSDITEVVHERDDYMLYYGFSQGLKNGVARRWTLGYRYREDQFSPGDKLPTPTVFPTDKRLSYPYLEYWSVVDDYTKIFNFDQIRRTEDLHLGHTFFSRLGYAASAFGSDDDRIVLEGWFDDTIFYSSSMLWRHKLEWKGLWNLEDDASEDIIVSYSSRYFRSQTKRRSFFASLDLVYAKNLNTNQQVVFGGDTGARAFDNRLQTGDRRVKLTLEERLYTDIHLLNLARLGWALFVDIGRAWEPGFDEGFEDDYLANIGFGIRLASTKADAGRVIHIDFAFPLTNKDDPAVDSSEITINIKNEF
jgi:outer membrane protein assembly factor BamA|tara:strand:- start:4427 stop:6109 length:1683 start_codon:yes stop_codon:yes gene_type:complete